MGERSSLGGGGKQQSWSLAGFMTNTIEEMEVNLRREVRNKEAIETISSNAVVVPSSSSSSNNNVFKHVNIKVEPRADQSPKYCSRSSTTIPSPPSSIASTAFLPVIRIKPLESLMSNGNEYSPSSKSSPQQTIDGLNKSLIALQKKRTSGSDNNKNCVAVPNNLNLGRNRPTDNMWRKNCRGIKSKLKYILENDNSYHDVTFIVGRDGQERIPGHKLLLRLGSPVFENLLFGHSDSIIARVADNGGGAPSTFEIADIEPFAFRQLMKFIYTDEFNAAGMTGSDIMEVLTAAKTFDIPDLIGECIESLKSNVTDENAVRICETAHQINDQELREVGLMYICRNAKNIFFSPLLMDLCYDNMVQLIQKDELDLDEIIIFKSVVRWADEFCKKRGQDPVPENLRGALGQITYKIRFPLMNAEEFSYEVAPTKVLTSEEQVQIFKYLCLSSSSGGSSKQQIEPLSFNCNFRNHMFPKNELKAIKEDIDEGGPSKCKLEIGASPPCQASSINGSIHLDNLMNQLNHSYSYTSSQNLCNGNENESEDAHSHVSSVRSQSSSSQISSSKKRKRSSSPLPKYSKLFGKTPPRSSDTKSSSTLKKQSSIDPSCELVFEDCEMEMGQLIEDIGTNPKRKEIECLRITNVTISSREKARDRRVRIPKLKQFVMDIKVPSLSHSDVNNLAGEEDVQDFLFFTLKVGKPMWKLSELWKLGIDITLIINGITLLLVSHGDKKVIINKLKAFNAVLESIGGESGVKRLIVSHQNFPSDQEFFPSPSLEQLILLSIKDEIPDVSKFLRRFKRLKDLSLLTTVMKKIDLSNDLMCKDRLRKFSIGNTRFTIPSPANNSFKNLEEIFFWKCNWSSIFEEHVHTLFPSLRKATILGNKVNQVFLKNILKIKSMEELWCGQYEWNSKDDDHDHDTHELLIAAGLTEADRGFVLSRPSDEDSSTWKGRKMSFESSQEVIYYKFQYNHFYVSYATFRS